MKCFVMTSTGRTVLNWTEMRNVFSADLNPVLLLCCKVMLQQVNCANSFTDPQNMKHALIVITAMVYTRTEGTCSLYCKYINKCSRDRDEIWHSHFNANEGENECSVSVSAVFLSSTRSYRRRKLVSTPQMKLSVSMNPELNVSLPLHCVRMFTSECTSFNAEMNQRDGRDEGEATSSEIQHSSAI